VRETRPQTVEFRQAEGTRTSSRVPNRPAQLPGSASTASSGEKRGPSYAASAAVSSCTMAPLPVQPSTNTTSAASCRAATWSSAAVSMPTPRTIETL
jgi:hypothetical protein